MEAMDTLPDPWPRGLSWIAPRQVTVQYPRQEACFTHANDGNPRPPFHTQSARGQGPGGRAQTMVPEHVLVTEPLH